MLKKLKVILNVLIGLTVGVFAGQAAFVWWDYKAHPDMYAAYSAPWYTGILTAGAVCAAVLFVLLVVNAIAGRKERQRSSRARDAQVARATSYIISAHANGAQRRIVGCEVIPAQGIVGAAKPFRNEV